MNQETIPSLPNLETLCEDLYISEFERLFQWASRRIGNAEDAEDVTQSTFEKFFKALQDDGTCDKNRISKTAVSFLNQIHNNNILDFLRGHSLRYKIFDFAPQVDDGDDVDGFPDQKNPWAEERALHGEILRHVISITRPQEAQLFAAMAHGNTVSEIAAEIDATISATKARMHRLRLKLKKRMRKDFGSHLLYDGSS